MGVRPMFHGRRLGAAETEVVSEGYQAGNGRRRAMNGSPSNCRRARAVLRRRILASIVGSIGISWNKLLVHSHTLSAMFRQP